MSINATDFAALIPDPDNKILQEILDTHQFIDGLSSLFAPKSSKIVHGVLFVLIEIINNLFYFCLINYERFGGDPMKRSVKNRLIAQTGYVMIMTNFTVTPIWAWRAFFGPLDPCLASIADALRHLTLVWLVLCFTECIALKALLTLKWNKVSAMDEEFWGIFLWIFNASFSIGSHIARYFIGHFLRSPRVQILTGILIGIVVFYCNLTARWPIHFCFD